MKKEYYVDDITMFDVIPLEEHIFSIYQNVIRKFKKELSNYNCTIQLMECWTTESLNDAKLVRPASFEKKYYYWICYQLLHEGLPIIYDDENSPLERSYCAIAISRVNKRNKNKFVIKEFYDTEDVEKEFAEDFNKIKEMFPIS